MKLPTIPIINPLLDLVAKVLSMLPIEGIAKHYRQGRMEQTIETRIQQGRLRRELIPPDIAGGASTPDEANIGRIVIAEFQSPVDKSVWTRARLIVADCSAPQDRARHIAEGLIIEVGYEVARRGGWAWDGTKGEGKTRARIIGWVR